MKRDWEVIREILTRLEESQTPNASLTLKGFPERDEQLVGYQLMLLKDAGCVECVIHSSNAGDGRILAAMIKRLTNSGHDLLQTIRNDTLWNKIKSTFAEKGLEMTIESVQSLGKLLLKSMLGG